MNRALGALLFGATLIGLSPIFVRLSEAGPTATAFWRVALAVPVLWIVWIVSRHSAAQERKRAPRRLLWAAGATFAGDLAFWHASIGLTSVANSTLLANLAALFVTLAAWVFLRQRPTLSFLAGLGAALFGVALLLQSNLRLSAASLLGDALGVITALFYAGYLLSVKGLRDRGAATLEVMLSTSAITALLLLPVALATGEAMLPATPMGWATLIGLALVSHAAGQGLIAYALAHLPASFSSVSLLVQPVAAAAFAWLLLDERLAPLQVAGGMIVLAGIYFAGRGSRF